MASALDGTPVVALCGKVWVPGRDPKKYPVCPMCKEIYGVHERRRRRGQGAARAATRSSSLPGRVLEGPRCARAHSGGSSRCHEVVETSCGHVHVLHNLLGVVQSETVIAYVATHARRNTHEARPPPGRIAGRRRRHRDRLRPPDVRQLLLRQGREERARYGSGSSRRSTPSRRKRSSTRSWPTSRRRTKARRSTSSTSLVETPRPAHQGRLQRPRQRPRRHRVRHTDTAGYVKDGGLMDVTEDFRGLGRGQRRCRPHCPAVRHRGRQDLRRPVLSSASAPCTTGPTSSTNSASKPLKSLDELASTARKASAPRSLTPTASRSAAPRRTARCPSSGNGGEPATGRAARTPRRSTAPPPRRASRRTRPSSATTTAPPRSAPAWAATTPSPRSPPARPPWRSAAIFSRQAVEAGKVKGKYAVAPLPGVEPGSIAPAFAGGNNIDVLKSTSHRTPRRRPDAAARVEAGAGRDVRRDGLPADLTDVRQRVAAEEPFVAVRRHLAAARSSCRPRPRGRRSTSSQVLPTMFQEVVKGKKGRGAAAGTRLGRWMMRLARR